MRHPTLSRRWFVHRVRIRHSRFIYERPSQCLQRLLGAVCGNQPAMDSFVGINAGTVSPAELFDPANIGRLLAPV